MALQPATRIGAYEINEQLGVGGMGEVYRATDTRLKRDVAIKVLPTLVAQDAERLARFQREAEVLAQLNHPNIAAIHGLEESDGIKALVMELVEGPTLADRIAQGAIPVDDALPIVKQIAEALEAAHEQGIIHRDLKPANIKIRPDGTVKVLDFGLARAIEPTGVSASSINASMSPTITTPAMTQAGMILGTAAYMSPEQARGKRVDRRADIWAFGCVLYEMLTGVRAFEGEDVSDTLGNVLKVEPNWNALPDTVPPLVRGVLRACLQKNAKQRLDSAQDARLALDGAFETSSPNTAPPVASPRPSVVFGVAAAGLVVGAAIAGAAVWQMAGRARVPAGVERLSVTTPAKRPVGIFGTPSRALALSPDGAQLVYVTNRQDEPAGQQRRFLALRSLATREVHDLPGTARAAQPFFSPDGQWVAFFTAADETGVGDLKKISLGGGTPVTVARNINGSQWAFGVWLDDGTIVFGGITTGLRRVSADGGAVTDLTTLDTARGETSHRTPVVVPSAGAVLFTSDIGSDSTRRIDAVTPDTGERRVVAENAWGPLVIGGAYLLLHRQDTTLIAPFDARRLTLAGPAVPLAEAVRPDNANRSFPLLELAVSRNGTLAYLPASETNSALGLVGRDGTFEPLGVPPGAIGYPRVAPDGQHVAFVEGQEQPEVRVYDRTRGSTTRVGQLDAVFGPAVWRADGRSLAVEGRKGDTKGVFLEGLDGSERLLVPTPAGASVRNIAWSPDGAQLAYTVQTGAQHDVWTLTLAGDPTSAPLLNKPASEYSPAFSPDGRWLAYTSDESGRNEVYVQPYPRGERLPVSVQGGVSPVWRRDGRELFFAGPDDKMLAVSVTPAGASLQLGKPMPLFDRAVTGPTGDRAVYDVGNNAGIGYDVLPDGRFVMVRSPDQLTAREIVIVRNWLEELKRLVPTP